MTEPCARFFKAHWELLEYVGFVIRATYAADERTELLANVEAEAAAEWIASDEYMREAQRFEPLIAETLLIRTVDNYLCYISELLALVFRSRPETLRSEGEVPISFVLEHPNMDELIEALAERRVERLAYLGMRQLADDVKKKMSFELFPDRAALDSAIALIEARNLIVHNRGVVNAGFLRRMPSSPLPEMSSPMGTRLKFGFDNVFGYLYRIGLAARDVDTRAAEKWALTRPRRAADIQIRAGRD